MGADVAILRQQLEFLQMDHSVPKHAVEGRRALVGGARRWCARIGLSDVAQLDLDPRAERPLCDLRGARFVACRTPALWRRGALSYIKSIHRLYFLYTRYVMWWSPRPLCDYIYAPLCGFLYTRFVAFCTPAMWSARPPL